MKNKIKKEIIIFGTGLLSEVVTEYFENFSPYHVHGYMHDSKKKISNFLKKPVYNYSQIDELTDKSFFIAVGYRNMNTIRENIFNNLKKKK